MDLSSHSGRACLSANRHSCLSPVETTLDCRLLGKQLTTSYSSPIRRTFCKRADTPVIKRGLSHKRKSYGADKENYNSVLCPEQRLPPVGLSARLALFPCVTARSNSSSQQQLLLDTNTETCIGGFNKCLAVPSYETDAVEISQGSPELSSGSTSVWSADHHDFSQTLVSSEEAQDFDPNTSSVNFLPPNSPLRSSSPLCRERCTGTPDCRSSTTQGFASTAEIENVYTGRSLRDVSSISQTSTTSLHEQISGSSLIGAFCSTFSYPLHSTIIEEHNSLSPISTGDTDLQYCDGNDASSNPDPVRDDTLVKTRLRCLGEPQSTCSGSDRELTNIYLSLTNKTVVEDSNVCCIPPYSPSRTLVPLVQSSPCEFNCSRMFASQYDGTQRSNDNLGSSGFAETTDVFNISSHMSSTSSNNSLRVKLHRKLKRQTGCARLDALLHHRTIIPRSRSTIENDKNESLSFLTTQSLNPQIMELSHGGQSRMSQLDPTRFSQMPTILEMAEKNPTPCSPSASRDPNNDTWKQRIPPINMSETSRKIHEPLRPHKGIQYKNSSDVSPSVTMVPCCVEHNREPRCHGNRTKTRRSFRLRDTDNVHSKCCCSESVSRTVHHMRETEGVLGRSSRTRRCSTLHQTHHLQRRKALMRKLRHFRRTIYGDDDESNCQFKIFAQI